MHSDQHEKVWHAKIDSSGRILVPAELRHSMGAEVGSPMILTQRNGALVVRSFDDVLEEIQSYYKSLAPADQVWSEELIDERRIEAKRD
jgi:bifunctional DNA-binding transcriptional regulator/antitoxin component of YhaV-PrlF toxin-antitoxin module